jgi:hypothetical protein
MKEYQDTDFTHEELLYIKEMAEDNYANTSKWNLTKSILNKINKRELRWEEAKRNTENLIKMIDKKGE